MRPTHLRVEHLDEPLGITVREPRLSWRLPEGTSRQFAYQVCVDSWDSGRVESDQSVLVPYTGPAHSSGQRVHWSVRVWTDAGESEWSEPGWWEMGLPNPADWTSRWIEPAEPDEVRARSPRPAWLMRGTVTLDKPTERARLYVTAHGIYEFFVNGRRVGDSELTPGFTSYDSTLLVQTFDVTDLLQHGENVLGAIVSDGWFRGQKGGPRTAEAYGDTVSLLAQLNVHGRGGVLTRCGTGPDWRARTGAILAADLMEGQTVNLGQEPAGWKTIGAVLDGWSRVTVRDHDLTRLRASPAPPVRCVETLRPISITRPRSDRQVVDFGQNLAGWIRLSELGPAGTTLTLTHGEALAPDGDVTQANLRLGHVESLPEELSERAGAPFQVDRVVSAGGDAVFEPRHTTHGFQYVRVEGHPEGLTLDDITAAFVHTDFRRTGWFTCSDDRINRLHEAAVRSFRGNAIDIPTDCPTRERAGWTGDWQIFVGTAAFLYDVAGFSAKWLADLAAEQQPDGVVLHCAPNSMDMDFCEALGIPPGSAGWGDAAVIVPWEVYRSYRDIRLLEEQWPSMVAWVEYAARAARDKRHPSRIATRPQPAAHEEYLWDTGFHWGEWLEPDSGLANENVDVTATLANLGSADHGDVATAFLHYSTRLLSQIAEVLGRKADAKHYRELAAATKAAWQAEFLRADGTLTPDTQATYVRALAFSLVTPDRRPDLAARLVELIRKADTHLGTGFLATPDLLPVLADNGHLDVAYELLFQDTEPSWLTMLDRGANTIWEDWRGVDEAGVAHLSLNHYSKGAVITFLHRYVAGIQCMEPAYRRFRIAPQPGGGITSATAAHESPYGRIESSWHLDANEFSLDVTVPPGTTADIRLPDGHVHEAQPGSHHYACVIAQH